MLVPSRTAPGSITAEREPGSSAQGGVSGC